MFSLYALAQQAPPAGGGLSQMLVFIGITFAVFYFMMLRPQQKKARAHEAWLKSLKKGDEVVTQSGIVGRVAGITDQFITLEVADKVRIKVLRNAVSGKAPEPKRALTEEATTTPAEEKK